MTDPAQLTAASRLELTRQVDRVLYPQWQAEQEHLNKIDRWVQNEPTLPALPRSATPELRALRALSSSPWLGLVVSIRSQCCLVDGYRSPDDPAPVPGVAVDTPSSRAWRIWEANDMDARQVALHRDAFSYGWAYLSVLPGSLPDGTPMPVMRPISPKRLHAVYEDPASDEWAVYALEVGVKSGATGLRKLRLFDEQQVHTFVSDGTASRYVSSQVHGVGYVPIVRYLHRVDSEGRAKTGGIGSLITTGERINKDEFDRLLAQHFTGWQVRYVAGMQAPEDEEERNREKLRLRQDDMLIAENPDVKFGTLPATSLDGLLAAKVSDIQTLSATAQVPTHALTGQLVNLSADALASARAQLDQMLAESKTALGMGHKNALQLGAAILGDTAAAGDYMARITWQDTSIRSLAAAADALGKIATQLGVPVQALWSLIPGVTRSTVTEWQRLAEAQPDPMSGLTAALTAAS